MYASLFLSRQTPPYLLAQLIKDSKYEANEVRFSLRKFHHKFVQNSVIVRFERNDTSSSDETETIIIGAHQDSLNYKMPYFRAPGSDDDGVSRWDFF